MTAPPMYEPNPPRAQRKQWPYWPAATVVTVGALVTIGILAAQDTQPEPAAPAAPANLTIEGSISVNLYDLADYGYIEYEYGDPCVTDGGYDDIRAGAQVVVSNPQRATIAL